MCVCERERERERERESRRRLCCAHRHGQFRSSVKPLSLSAIRVEIYLVIENSQHPHKFSWSHILQTESFLLYVPGTFPVIFVHNVQPSSSLPPTKCERHLHLVDFSLFSVPSVWLPLLHRHDKRIFKSVSNTNTLGQCLSLLIHHSYGLNSTTTVLL